MPRTYMGTLPGERPMNKKERIKANAILDQPNLRGKRRLVDKELVISAVANATGIPWILMSGPLDGQQFSDMARARSILVLCLHKYSGMSYTEMGEMFRISRVTAYRSAKAVIRQTRAQFPTLYNPELAKLLSDSIVALKMARGVFKMKQL